MRRGGNNGIDETEFDFYESSFWKNDPVITVNVLHYDGSTDLIIDYVKVYQKDIFRPYIQLDSEFSDKSSLFNNLKISAIVIGSILGLGIIGLCVYKLSRKKTKTK